MFAFPLYFSLMLRQLLFSYKRRPLGVRLTFFFILFGLLISHLTFVVVNVSRTQRVYSYGSERLMSLGERMQGPIAPGAILSEWARERDTERFDVFPAEVTQGKLETAVRDGAIWWSGLRRS